MVTPALLVVRASTTCPPDPPAETLMSPMSSPSTEQALNLTTPAPSQEPLGKSLSNVLLKPMVPNGSRVLYCRMNKIMNSCLSFEV